MKKNHYLHFAFASLLMGNFPSVYADTHLQNEAKIINNTNFAEVNCNLNKDASSNCLNVKNTRLVVYAVLLRRALHLISP